MFARRFQQANGVAYAVDCRNTFTPVADVRCRFAHVVHRQGLGQALDDVDDIVHRADQLMDFVAVKRGDEGFIQQAMVSWVTLSLGCSADSMAWIPIVGATFAIQRG